MKQLTCEMCGSTDLMKQDGVFVCQTCGCKYSVEEAKKMMVEGTVEVQGTVKVDNSAFVEKYLANARRAKSKEDWEETEKYYNMVEQNDPSNIEAIFYSSFGKAKMSLVDADIYKRQQVFKVLTNCVSIIDDNYNIQNAKENEVAIKEMSKDIRTMRASNFVFTEWKNGYGIVTRTNKHETIILFDVLEAEFIDSLVNILKKDEKVYLYELIITHCNSLINYGTLQDYLKEKFDRIKRNAQDKKTALSEKIRKQEAQDKADRITKYWEEHADEKLALEAEDVTLKNQVEQIYSEAENVPGKEEIETLRNQRTKLQEELYSLGMFKGKQKKELQAKIDALNNKIYERENERRKQQEEIKKAIYPLNKRRREIDTELKKDRP